jgi:hypothetical protein
MRVGSQPTRNSSVETAIEAYRFIGKFALALHSQDLTISAMTLQRTLQDQGFQATNARGMRQVIAASYHYWQDRDPIVHRVMTTAFTA